MEILGSFECRIASIKVFRRRSVLYPVRERFRLVGRGRRGKSPEETIEPLLYDWSRGWLPHVLQALEEANYHMSVLRDWIDHEIDPEHTELP